MNVFALDLDPGQAAQWHCDKHVVKMCVEYAQLLSTAHRVLDGRLVTAQALGPAGRVRTRRWHLLPGETLVDGEVQGARCYAATHLNHPCALWTRESTGNYTYLLGLLQALLAEYTHRYGRVHQGGRHLSFLRDLPQRLPGGPRTPFAQAMPAACRGPDPVAAYRTLYQLEKARFCTWKARPVPPWFRVPPLT